MDETTITGAESENSVDWDNWDNLDLSDLQNTEDEEDGTDADEPVDQSEQEAEEAGDTPDEPGEEPQKTTDQTFILKHLDDVREVSRDEVIALAQKGLDYDRIREKFEAAETEAQSFLKELAAAQNVSVGELMNRVRAETLAKQEGIDFSVALGRVQNQTEAKKLQAEREKLQATQSQGQEQDRRQAAIRAFVAEYPDVQAQNIPRGVWDTFSKTGDLVSAYRADENRRLKEELKTLKEKQAAEENNKKNKSRSTGSQRGESGTQKDPFLVAWYDGT
jgi:hypothetical protein